MGRKRGCECCGSATDHYVHGISLCGWCYELLEPIYDNKYDDADDNKMQRKKILGYQCTRASCGGFTKFFIV